ncbi:sialidase family protein [Brachyspira pilosicoli]|uniref:sialidase family protein n=1 Tax=Brachyspira pilosicoli TaxID=52584 RepID=UPI003005D656
MSKKIIYLLSLVMALSLVFASCKKSNSVTGGDVPGEEPGTVTPPDLSSGGGLFTDQGKLEEYASKPVQASKIAEFGNNNYMRNPVITVIGGKTVVVFYEVRYESPGSANDVALTGTNVVDIAYTVSTDAGVSFDTSATPQYIGKATSPDNSHGAPIVFNTGSKIVVVASAGIGLSVGTYNGTDKVSKLQYAIADISGDNIGTFSEWKEIEAPNLSSTIFKQFGTHSARGVVDSTGNLLLPVTVVDVVTSNLADTTWGYILYKGKVEGNSVTWTKASEVITMPNKGTKATRIAKAGNSDSDYVFVSVNDRAVKLYQGKGNTNPPTETTIAAGDGAAGTLVVSNWKGAASYDPQSYKVSETSNPQSILSHVEVLEKQLAVRLVDTDFTKQVGNSFIPDEKYKNNSKSSTLDILGDGTIVLVAEGGKVNAGASERQFYIHFYRYTQAYLTTQTGN